MSELEETAIHLFSERPNETALKQGLLYVRSGQGDHLFKELLQIAINAGTAPLKHAMRRFEAIVAGNPELGMYLMGKLYPLAGRSDHDVYNAIELWAHHARSSEEAAGIEIAAGEARPRFKKQLVTWAHAIRGRAGS